MNTWQFFITIWISILAIIFSGLLAVIISHHLSKRYELRRLKFNTLSELLANRAALTHQATDEQKEKFFSVMNKLFVVFNDDPNVIGILRRFLKEKGKETTLFPMLIEKISNNIGLIYLSENDELILSPFQPTTAQGDKRQSHKGTDM